MITAKTSSNKNLSTNSVISYFCKLRAALNTAVDDELILVNPSLKVTIPKEIESKREYLTIEEVQLLFKTECRYDVLKRAFLFSCLTGMRWADVNKVVWSELHKEGENWKVTFHQKKTNGLQYHYVSKQARSLCGIETTKEDKIFTGIKYSAYMNTALMQWVLKAGISKHITLFKSDLLSYKWIQSEEKLKVLHNALITEKFVSSLTNFNTFSKVFSGTNINLIDDCIIWLKTGKNKFTNKKSISDFIAILEELKFINPIKENIPNILSHCFKSTKGVLKFTHSNLSNPNGCSEYRMDLEKLIKNS